MTMDDRPQTTKDVADRLLTTKEVADRLGVTPEYLAHLVRTKQGPPAIRLTAGGLHRFRWGDVEAWLKSRTAGK